MPPLDSQPVGRVAFAALDFESAGDTRGGTDVPIQVGIAGMDELELRPAALFRSFIHTDRDVTLAARKVHGITNRDLVGAPAFLDLWPELRARLGGRVLLAHGAGTEKRFLRAFPWHGFGPWLDSLTLLRKAYPDLPSHRLGDAIQALGLASEVDALCPGLRWHDALYDAVACAVLVRHVLRAAGLEEVPLRQVINRLGAGGL